MYVDDHRKYDLHMCYECGYMEGRTYGADPISTKHKLTNFERLRSMNENEAIIFISSGLHVEDKLIRSWMAKSVG
jgi:hypothetical protein